MGMTPADRIFIVLDSICIFFGGSLNALLIAAILLRSPPEIRSYRILLLNNAISDFLTCMISLWIEPRVVTHTQDLIMYVNHGLCKYFGFNYCLSYGIMINLYAHLNWSLLASFVYRWYVLYYSPPSKTTMLLLIPVICAPTIIVYCIIYGYIREHFDMDWSDHMLAAHPEMNITGLVITGCSHILTDYRATVPSSAVLLPIFPITLIVLFLRSRILAFLKKQNVMNENTKKQHKTFLKALTCLTCLPPFFVIGSSFFLVDSAFQLHQAPFEYGCYFVIGLVPILSPVCQLYFIKPYRVFVKQVLCHKSDKISPSQSSA